MPLHYTITNDNCLDYLNRTHVPLYGGAWDTIFADPPDNIGLGYDTYDDNLPEWKYVEFLSACLAIFVSRANTVWFSFNAKWIKSVAGIIRALQAVHPDLEDKFCVQTFTFGQHNSRDLGNNMRPLWRLRRGGAFHDPEAIRIESERQRMGDPRADPRGRVPGDVFDFPRVVGNSKQRRKWHKTQLHEGLVSRCLRLSTPAGGYVLDPFGGTGTTLRVAQRERFNCDTVELDPGYCQKMADESGLDPVKTIPPTWTRTMTGELEDLPLLGGKQDRRVQ
jgi:DNA modification methylase